MNYLLIMRPARFRSVFQQKKLHLQLMELFYPMDQSLIFSVCAVYQLSSSAASALVMLSSGRNTDISFWYTGRIPA